MKKMLFLCWMPCLMLGCTISFQNIDTHGTASDLVDENQAASPTVSPDITIPVSAVPSLPAGLK